MKNHLTNKPTNAVKPLLSSRGFALIATISILSLIALISLALLSLATTKTKVSSYSNHLNIARDNARLALEIAIGQLQKYTGPDQRVTARADITDKDWTNLTPQVANPYYHLAWDVSGSEIDYTANYTGYNNNNTNGHSEFLAGEGGKIGGRFEPEDFTVGKNNSYLHRPGMNPGHDFVGKKPAVLVSGNEFYDLIEKDGSGNLTSEYKVGDYPSNYVNQYTDLAAGGIARVEIIPSSSIMIPGSLDTGATNDLIKVEVPIVKVAGSTEGSSYAYWIGDESLKSRINLKSDLGEAASQVSQRAPLLESFQKKVADGEITADNINKRLTMPSLELNAATTEKKGFSYSPDVTTSSESLVVDVRNGGFKQDFTFSLYNRDPLSPIELKDNSIPLDTPARVQSKGLVFSKWSDIWSVASGLVPMVEKWRSLARKPVEKGVAIKVFAGFGNVGKDQGRGIYPLMSQVQMSQHLAFSEETIPAVAGVSATPLTPAIPAIPEQSGFSVHLGIFPSVTIWNPYNVPLELNADFSVALARRAFAQNGAENKLKTHYDLKKITGEVVETKVVWPRVPIIKNGKIVGRRPESWSGWTLSMRVPVQTPNPLIIQPGETIVFSPSQITLDDAPMNATPHKNVVVTMEPGWNPGMGILSRMDKKVHSLLDFGGVVPQARLIQDSAKENLKWTLLGPGRPGSLHLFFDSPTTKGAGGGGLHHLKWSEWSRLDAVAQNESSFFTVPPADATKRQDTSGSFPGLLVKHALRMGDDYLFVPAGAIKSGDQTEFSFPYVAGYNPAAISHAGFGDGLRENATGEVTNISPSLMGGVYDFQSANEVYPVATKASPERETATPIGLGYLNGEKLILMNRPFASKTPNGSSASITSFSQLNNSQFLKGRRRQFDRGSRDQFGYNSSSNIPAFPIGNSLGNPKLDLHHDEHLSQTTVPKFKDSYFMGGIGKVMYSDQFTWKVSSAELDYSYLLNEYLYDHYFFSTIPQASGAYDESIPLVNSRLVPSEEAKQDYKDNPFATVPASFIKNWEVFNELDDDTPEELEKYTNKLKSIDSAKYLTLVGGFNVNSTSVPAWEMLISSSLGSKRDGVGSPDKTVSFSNKEANSELAAGKVTEEDALDSDFHMTLTPIQVRALAEAMVSEVKRRGPFPSLSAFVNRANFLKDMARPNPNEYIGSKNIIDARYSGAIQSALDRIGANESLDSTMNTDRVINQSGFTTKTSDGIILPAKEALRKTVNSHLPGYLKQSDVLSQIAPVVTVRGDTFTIRCFGASGEGPDGLPIAKAVCEAVVQRGKEFVDSTDEPGVAVRTVFARAAGTTSTLSAMNQVFGRKYKIVSFKWLSQAEVAKMNISDL